MGLFNFFAVRDYIILKTAVMKVHLTSTWFLGQILQSATVDNQGVNMLN